MFLNEFNGLVRETGQAFIINKIRRHLHSRHPENFLRFSGAVLVGRHDPVIHMPFVRFLGGVTDISRRSRRAKLLAEILVKSDFRVDIRGDLVIARIKKLDLRMMEEKMKILGLLVAFTRQLDVKMSHEQEIERLKNVFQDLKNDHIKNVI